ncbi:hypothetical protein [Hydrogenimonas sp.]
MKPSTRMGVAASALLLGGMIFTGCGGGGGSSSPAVTSTTLTGTAVDELFDNGVVTVYQAGTQTQLAAGRTDANGTYTLKVTYKGAVAVEVTCDDNTYLVFSENNRSKCLDIHPDGIALHSATVVEGGTVPVNISPLSEVAYQIAEEKGLDAAAIEKANAQIAFAFGVDPVQTNPLQRNYSAIVTTFHTLAQEENLSLTAVIETLAEDAADGTIGDDSTLPQKMAEAMKKEGIKNTLTENNGTITLPENPAPLDDVAAVQNFVKELRTQVNEMGDFLENEANNIGDTLSNVAMDIDAVASFVAGMGELIQTAYEENKTAITDNIEVVIDGVDLIKPVTLTQTSGNTWTYTTTIDDAHTYTGTFTLPPLEEGVQNTFDTLEADFNGILPVVIYTQDGTKRLGEQTVKLHVKLTRNDNVTSVLIDNGSITSQADVIKLNTLEGTISYSEDENNASETVFNYVKLDKVELEATMGDYHATGTLSVPSYVQNDHLATTGFALAYYSDVQVAFTCEGNIQYETIYLDYNGEQYSGYQSYYEPGTLVWGFSEIEGNITEDQVLNGLVNTPICFDSDNNPIEINKSVTISPWTEEEGKLTNSAWVPEKVAFVGLIKNNSTITKLDGTINVTLLNAKTIELDDLADITDDQASEAKLDVTMAVTLERPNNPKTLLNAHYKTLGEETKYHILTASMTLNDTSMSLEGYANKNGEDALLTFSAPNNMVAKFIFKNGNLVPGVLGGGKDGTDTGSLVTKNGKTTATIEDREGAIIIKYLDGYFETIF